MANVGAIARPLLIAACVGAAILAICNAIFQASVGALLVAPLLIVPALIVTAVVGIPSLMVLERIPRAAPWISALVGALLMGALAWAMFWPPRIVVVQPGTPMPDFSDTIFGWPRHADWRRFLQRVAGYVLSGSVSGFIAAQIYVRGLRANKSLERTREG